VEPPLNGRAKEVFVSHVFSSETQVTVALKEKIKQATTRIQQRNKEQTLPIRSYLNKKICSLFL
jgi:hypothetical protein